MKNRFVLGLFGLLVCFACSNENQEKVVDEQPKITFEEPVIPSAAFASFVNGFESELPPSVYDTPWLEAYLDNNQVREISPKVCEEFIHGKEVWNHSFGQEAKKKLAAEKPYYYIGQISDTGNYIMLIFTDLEENATETYLCTYTKAGKFISGIILQANYEHKVNAKATNSSKRICRIPANSKPTLMFEDSTTEKGMKSITYSISRSGEIQIEQKSS